MYTVPTHSMHALASDSTYGCTRNAMQVRKKLPNLQTINFSCILLYSMSSILPTDMLKVAEHPFKGYIHESAKVISQYSSSSNDLVHERNN